ncbi:MAG: malto-oligosyltrehalose trehalohydrolase [Steroidobacteraceae bacterium]
MSRLVAVTPVGANVEMQHPCLGAVGGGDGVRFRVWAPQANQVEVLIEGAPEPVNLERAQDGYFDGASSTLRPGALYRYRVDGKGPYPDPCSRYQPQGPHGPSLVVDPTAYRWHDANWSGIELHGQVIYELHIGTFTPEGTFDAAIEKFDHLITLGITVIELMPLAECPGRWNWGYDGVDLFAPYHVYGDHEACKRFIDAAHARGLAVILDVVYNHLGPDGNYLSCFSPHYFSTQYETDWGEPLNFDGEHARGVRDFIIGNACYWLREFHVDGFRLDATQSIFDASRPHILAELIHCARRAAGERKIIFVAENEPQCAEHLRPPTQGGFGLDAMWNDDYHHTARVALTGSRDGYYHDYLGTPQELVSAVKRGFLYQGQYYSWQKQRRGSPLPQRWDAAALVIFLQNHDQVANTFSGVRCVTLTSAGRLRALTALTLLAPQTPLLFMGQEFGASTPFAFFADHQDALAAQVHQGRRQFMSQFRAEATSQAQAAIPAPKGVDTFMRSKLDWSEAAQNTAWLQLHRDLLRIRCDDPVISRQAVSAIDGAVLSSEAFVLRWFDESHGDRLLVVNTGKECLLEPAPEPLLAPPWKHEWQLVWSSDDTAYGGRGALSPTGAPDEPGWRLTAESAVLLVGKRRVDGG